MTNFFPHFSFIVVPLLLNVHVGKMKGFGERQCEVNRVYLYLNVHSSSTGILGDSLHHQSSPNKSCLMLKIGFKT